MDRLADAWRDHRAPHLVTVLDGRAHVVPVGVDVAGGAFRIDAPGRRARAGLARNPQVTLVWSPYDDGGYSLIVDGTAELDGDVLLVSPTRAVLHRPGAPSAPGGSCGADCVELDPTLP
ncbi:pyridoxamine 5'-phosphate oxidase family protein [Pseudonocardia endophytica]|uniref:Pyridoxamine 5'-phosphate oxidase n=1 Tax=Pseudonocardia endophytica TaxID=401976 RepID=A0A4V2PIL7_PSEEN|nr:pyridoxamine 5'-phosphate oxidase family protein [Pseudonocardia endophytica]TCK25166.1 pyridoxamine 5'-phosphate oxidase [Pseudonocardia endophytica]